MKKGIFCCIFVMLAYAACCYAGYTQSVSSAELLNDAKQYDGKAVVYQGEAIGDIMIRGDHAWVNLNDGGAAIGIWIRKIDLKDIAYLGSYRAKGDVIEVTGTFNRSCREHGGDLDIHAQEIKKVSSGAAFLKQLSFEKFCIGIFLTFVLLLFYSVNKSLRCRRRQP